jgi:hypothetical protein
MTHAEVCNLFLKWFIANSDYFNWFVFQNNTGFASIEKVKYGIPNTGGGSDFFAFGNSQTEFFEIKTLAAPKLNRKQIIFMDNMTKQNFKCWVFRENKKDPGYKIERWKIKK